MSNTTQNENGPNIGHVTALSAQLATGVPVSTALKNVVKDASIDRLLGPTAVFAGGLVGALRTMKSIVDQSGILDRIMQRVASAQQVQGKFETILKSAEAATTRIKELYKYAATTPFNFNDLAEANRVLETLTHGALSGARGMKLIGDAAAATGEPLGDVAEQVGKLYNALASGRSFDRVILGLQMTGVVTNELVGELETAKSTGASFADMWGLVEKSMKRTEGGMQNEMKTLDALSARLDNASKAMEKAFGEPFIDAQATAIENTIKATENLTPVLANVGRAIAPALQFMTGVKNEIMLATLASKQFVSVLSVGVTGAIATATGLAGASLASLLVNGGGSLIRAGRFASGTLGTAVAVRKGVSLQGVNDLRSQSSEAFKAGAIGSGVSFAAQALAARAKLGAQLFHQTAKTVAMKDGGFSVWAYAGAAATQIVAKGFTLAWGAIRGAAASLGVFIATPAGAILAIGTGVIAVANAATMMADKISKANTEFVKLIQNMGAAKEDAFKLADNAKDIDQWRVAIGRLTSEIEKLNAEQENTVGLTGQDLEDANDRNAERDRRAAQLTRKRGETVARVDQMLPGQAAKNRAVEETSSRIGAEKAQRESAAAMGDDLTRNMFLRTEESRLNRAADRGAVIAKGIDAPELFKDNPTELMQTKAQIAEMERTGIAPDGTTAEQLYNRQAEQADLASSRFENRGQALALAAQARELGNAMALKDIELSLETEIAAVRKKGGETATLEAEKQLLLLRAQGVLARRQGRSLDERQAQAEIDVFTSNQARFRADAGLERAKNIALAANNPRGAQALQDNADRQRLRDSYTANGLTVKQADADFNQSLFGAAGVKPPSIVADSLQSVGGGGGSYGSDPMAAAAKRAADTQAAYLPFLKIIAEAATGKKGQGIGP